MRSWYLFGLIVGVLTGIMRSPLLPQPSGMAAFMCVLAAQTLVATVLTWHRTHLAWMTASAATATAGLLGMAWLHLHGVTLTQWPWAAVIGLDLGVGVVFGVAERWAHPAQWEAWKAATRQASFRDVVLWRHIPRLR